MPSIPFLLRRGEYEDVIFDEVDVPWVLSLPARRLQSNGTKPYAQCTIVAGGVATKHLISRLIAGLLPGDPREADHINGNSVDNRRANLRVVSRQMQQQNLKPFKSRCGKLTASSYRGVNWYPKRRRWLVFAQVCGNRVYGGSFVSEDDAGHAGEALRTRLLGEAFAAGILDRPEPVPSLADNCVLRDILSKLGHGHWASRRTHCKHGHPFNEENTLIHDAGHRICRACRKRIERDYRIRKSAERLVVAV